LGVIRALDVVATASHSLVGKLGARRWDYLISYLLEAPGKTIALEGIL
jgi:hypothetical protein